MSDLKNRKLWAAVVVFVISIIFFFFGKMDADQWISLTKWTFGIFATGNGVEHIAGSVKAALGPK